MGHEEVLRKLKSTLFEAGEVVGVKEKGHSTMYDPGQVKDYLKDR